MARLKDEQARTSLVQKIVDENLSLREVQLWVTTNNPGNKDKSGDTVTRELTDQYATLGKRLKRSPALRDEKKRQRIQKLLDQLDKLLA